MSKGRYANNKKTGKKWILLLVLVVILAALVVFAVKGGKANADLPEETQSADNTAAATENSEVQAPESETAGTEAPVATDAPTVTEAPAATETPKPAQTEAPEEPTKAPAPVISTEPPPVQIIQRAEAEYEKWLAATMIVCVSMEYPDFQLEGIYTSSATALENAMDSEGTYVLFTSGGLKMALYSKPLTEERTAAGTKDISSQTLGFASYDLVSPAAVDTASMEEIKVEDLGELIAQSVLVTIYEH